jgi:isopentenyl-diphosphate delta-isomerase
MNEERVILVNVSDEPTGTMEKTEAHRKAKLHRAFSIFIFNSKGEMLLQQRAFHKYHSGGLWSNACCSHPRPGEDTLAAAERRLTEEMGFNTPLKKIFDFVYKAELDKGLAEYEFDHVFAGEYNGTIKADPEEVSDFCFKELKEIKLSLQSHPQNYTAWFHLAFPRVEEWYALEEKNAAAL